MIYKGEKVEGSQGLVGGNKGLVLKYGGRDMYGYNQLRKVKIFEVY